MKNDDPPHRNGHKPATRAPKITPELQRFIQQMGGYFESSGIPPIGGRILGLLMISHNPLSVEDIASILKVSRASISTNFRVLSASGLVEKFTSHTDRLTYYLFPDAAWEQAMILSLRRAQVFKRIVQDGLSGLAQKDEARLHLHRGVEYADLVTHFYQQLIDEWRLHHQHPVPAR